MSEKNKEALTEGHSKTVFFPMVSGIILSIYSKERSEQIQDLSNWTLFHSCENLSDRPPILKTSEDHWSDFSNLWDFVDSRIRRVRQSLHVSGVPINRIIKERYFPKTTEFRTTDQLESYWYRVLLDKSQDLSTQTLTLGRKETPYVLRKIHVCGENW